MLTITDLTQNSWKAHGLQYGKDFVLRHRFSTVLMLQLVLVLTGYTLAFWLRFDFSMTLDQAKVMLTALPLLLLCRLLSYHLYKLNSGWWRFVGMVDLVHITKAVLLGSLLFFMTFALFDRFEGFPRSILIMEAVLNLILLGGARFGLRWFRDGHTSEEPKQCSHKLIVGAGGTAVQLLYEIERKNELGIRVIGFVDDDPHKQGAYIHGIPVLGTCEHISQLVAAHAVDELVIAMPSAGYKKIMAVTEIAHSCGIQAKVLPRLTDLIQLHGLWGQLRDIPSDELLGRPIIRFARESDISLLRNEIQGKSVLITGAAGSIGSELSHQTAQYNPKELILYDHNENELYFLELKLREQFPKCNIITIIGDILNEQKFRSVVTQHQVRLIYHAAAYKHVPMMEREPLEAIRNNVLATETVARVALDCRVKKCVYISTDKAVNPSSVMGATKRIGEMIMHANSCENTKLVSVRFGNVIGSNGSVIQLFKKQMQKGGPITVTHPEASRYFMAISEAVQLVMTAGAMGNGGEIFMLDMGEPIKIVDLARRLIQSSSLTPGKDIEIQFIGLRPGEKVHEELYWQNENIVPTSNKKITMLKGNGIAAETLAKFLYRLRQTELNGSAGELMQILAEMVPEGTFYNANGHAGNRSLLPKVNGVRKKLAPADAGAIQVHEVSYAG